MTAKKLWNVKAVASLLRYGRKNDGGWTDIEKFWDEDSQCLDGRTIPDESDATLICAAPQLLAACEKMHVAWHEGGDEIEAIKALEIAIMYARGERE